MKILPKISNQINEKLIHKVIKKNYADIGPFFYYFMSNWLIRSYERYNDIDKFVIIIYLIHQNLIVYRRNGLIFDFDTFYQDRTLEIEKINISDISKDLNIPKESVRRKIIELENREVIKKVGKKIFIDRSTFQTAKATDTVKELCVVLNEFNKLLKKEKLINNVFEIDQMTDSIKKNFSFCLYQFNKFIFIYLSRWRTELGDLETFSVGMIVLTNAMLNKEFSPSKIDLKTYTKKLMGTDSRGVNAMSISEITGIPRPTVVRKLKYLIDNKWLQKNEKKLISLNIKDSTFSKSQKMAEKNMLSFSHFVHRLFNQINIINS